MTQDEKYMARCLELARHGRFGAAPNPMVGAVVVHDNRIVGEGYHIRCGGAHAEVNAIRAVRDPQLLPECTIYVSLEPCAHYGKTPPCADLIISKGLRRVVVGCVDPFAKVAGEGIRRIREAGISVSVGVLEQECLALNQRFFAWCTLRRPFVTLKWAESADGYVDARRPEVPDCAPTVFSTPYTRMLVHRQRTLHQAIMVGSGTALADNPRLDNRTWPGRTPLRVVLDRQGSLPASLHIMADGRPTRVYLHRQAPTPAYASHTGVTCIRIDFDGNVPQQVLDDLYACGVQSLLVEGGPRLHKLFLEQALWDEARIECSPQLLGQGTAAAPMPAGVCRIQECDGHQLLHIVRQDAASRMHHAL